MRTASGRQVGSAHVGLNLVFLVPGETGGMETYARRLIPALVTARPDMRFTAFVNRETSEVRTGPWADIPSVEVPIRARRRAEWVRGEQQLLPRLAARSGVDLVHSLASTAPARGRFRRIVTIHDLIYRIYPEAHFGIKSYGMRLLVPLAARRSDRIIVPSDCTKSDLVRFLGVAPEVVDVVPQGVTAAPQGPLGDEPGFRRRLGLGSRAIVLTLSAKRPHKNLGRLLEALSLIPVEKRPMLVLPGYHTPHEAELRRSAARLGIENDTFFLGWVSEEELENWYAVAAAFVFPSLYEGFGLPVLEAMARGLPVACSNRGSIAEVASSAARLFDPEQPRDIADSILALIADKRTADRLRRMGLDRARQFSWQATAQATLATYERALRGP